MMEDFNSAMASIERGLAAADVAGALADSMSRDVYRQTVGQRVHRLSLCALHNFYGAFLSNPQKCKFFQISSCIFQ